MNRKVAIVGAGSASFGLASLSGLLGAPGLGGVEVALHDVDEVAVRRMGSLGAAVVRARGLGSRVTWTTELPRALDGADCVILSVAQDREATWKKEREIALRFGINHYAENGGPAALFHGARSIGLAVPVVRQMERSCPEALLVNYTNPLPRVCTAVAMVSDIRCVGVCHQVEFGYYLVGVLLSGELGIELPPAPDFYFRWTDRSCGLADEISAAARKKIHIQACGVNHFTWALAVTDRQTGDDLYPLLRERNRTFDAGFEPLSRKVFDLFGVLPTPGDTHLAEYLPFTHNPQRGGWERYDIQMYDFDWAQHNRARQVALVESMLAGGDLRPMDGIHSERAELVAGGWLGAQDHADEALNLPNRGAIDNLPEDAIVEVPVKVSRGTLQAGKCDPLPDAVAQLCQRQVVINRLSTRGILEGDRGKLVQALALDPMVDDPDLPEQLLDEYLRVFDFQLAWLGAGKLR